MSGEPGTTKGWRRLPCQTCGLEHRDDCPDRFERVESIPCGCDSGCYCCEWTGLAMRTVGGHKLAIPLLRRSNAATRFYAGLSGGEVV